MRLSCSSLAPRFLALAIVAALPASGEDQGGPAPGDPIAAGPLADSVVWFEFAIYAMPRFEGDVEKSVLAHLEELGSTITPTPEPSPEMALPAIQIRRAEAEEYPPPDVNYLRYGGRGLTDEVARSLQACAQVLVLDFCSARTEALATMREAHVLAEAISRDVGGLVWDEATRECFSPDAWRERRLDGWTEGLPSLSTHVVSHQYQDGPLLRIVTLGMKKFGLPDVTVNEVPRSLARTTANLVCVVCQILAETPEVAVEGAIEVDLDAIRDASVRALALERLKKNAGRKATLAIRVSRVQEGDADNRLIEIVFPGPADKDLAERQSLVLATIYGSEDSITRVEHDEELLAASRRAKERLPGLQERFAKGLAPGEQILVKGPFATPQGGEEWMWIEIVEWNEDRVRGILANDAFDIPGLRAGANVEVREEDVFDYLLVLADGSTEGNETGEILSKRERGGEE